MTQYIDRFGEQKIHHPLWDFWRAFETNTTALFGLLLFSLVILVMLLSPILAPYEANQQFSDAILSPPSWQQYGRVEYLLGTDDLGRDLFSRILIGGRTTIGSALIVVVVAAIFGVITSLITSFYGGWLDKIFSYFAELFLTFPSLITALLVVAILGPGLMNSVIAVTISIIPHFYKSTRNALMTEMRKPYYVAAKLDGARGIKLLSSVLLPNIISPVLIQISRSFSSAILEISTLGFLGFGAQSLLAEWGAMLGDARNFSLQAPWAVWLPGVAMVITLFAINLVGDGLRETLELEHHS